MEHHPSVPTAAALGLVQLAPLSVEPLIAAFQASMDQGLQAYIIQALAQISDRQSFDVLAEVSGRGSSQLLAFTALLAVL